MHRECRLARGAGALFATIEAAMPTIRSIAMTVLASAWVIVVVSPSHQSACPQARRRSSAVVASNRR
jgi:hypothetical protein